LGKEGFFELSAQPYNRMLCLSLKVTVRHWGSRTWFRSKM